MKKTFVVLVLVVLVGTVIGVFDRRQIAVRYHVWQSGWLYSLAMSELDNVPEREAYRNRNIQHSDALIRLGHWTNRLYRVRSIPDKNERMELMKKIDRSFPRDKGYYQMWGTVGVTGQEVFIKLWSEPAYVPMWEKFLNDGNVLIKEEGNKAATSGPADGAFGGCVLTFAATILLGL
jgi:hypothetical protein